MTAAPNITYKQANRRYRAAFWPTMVFYAVACFAGPAVMKAMGDPPTWVVAGIALVTALPVCLVFLLIGRWLRETDEYTRAVHIDAMMIGGGIVFSATIIWGFLEMFEVAPHLQPFFVAPGFFLAYGLTRCVQNLLGGKKERSDAQHAA